MVYSGARGTLIYEKKPEVEILVSDSLEGSIWGQEREKIGSSQGCPNHALGGGPADDRSKRSL
jgi:hypothetical protein